MRRNPVFEDNEVLYSLSEEEILKRKQRRNENIKKTSKMTIYIRPDLDEVVKKLKNIKIEEEALKSKKRIQLIDTTKNMKFFK